MIQNDDQTSSNLREKVAFNPFFLVFSFFSTGIKHALKAPGSDWNRDLNIPSVRIWKEKEDQAKYFKFSTSETDKCRLICGMISRKFYIYDAQDKSFLLQKYFKGVLKLKSPQSNRCTKHGLQYVIIFLIWFEGTQILATLTRSQKVECKEKWSFTNLSEAAKSTINTSKYGGEYSIPNLSIHKIYL